MTSTLPQYQHIATDGAAARLEIHSAATGPVPINPRIFGNFLEHLGFAVQGGVLAQLLRNPSFHTDHNVPEQDLAQLRKNGVTSETVHRLGDRAVDHLGAWRPHLRVTGFGVLVLDDETQYGIPLPWKVAPRGAGQGAQGGRIGQSVLLEPAGDGASLSQGVFLPHQRTSVYSGSVWVRARGEGSLRVELRRRAGSAAVDAPALARVELAWPGPRWTKFSFELEAPDGVLAPFEPVDFAIACTGPGRLWVDRAVLLPDDHVDGLDTEIVEMCRELAPPVLRGPGGNFVSGYRFTHGIGEMDRRQTFANSSWGGIDDNFFGTDEFLRLCERIGAEPHICVNMGDGVAEEAAAWVEYVNGPADSHWGAQRAANGHPEPYGVKLWEVGNEIYGFWQIGHCGPSENARRYREWSEAMLAVDPSIELIANGSHFGHAGSDELWHEILLEEGGADLHCISLHCLPNNARWLSEYEDDVYLWQSLMAQTLHWEEIGLPELLSAARGAYPDRTIDVAITEWGILGPADRPQVGNLGGAVYAGLFLNFAIRQHEMIRVANATALLHGGCIRRAGPFVYRDPQVEVIERYTTLRGARIMPVTYKGPAYDVDRSTYQAPPLHDVPYLDAVAVDQGDGRSVIAVVNRHPIGAIDTTIAFDAPLGSVTSCDVLTGAGFVDVNTPLRPGAVRFQPYSGWTAGDREISITLPPRSVTWITLGAAGAAA